MTVPANRTVKLSFDPLESVDERLRAVFEDAEARKLWLLWRSGHITDQHFNDECLTAARHIRGVIPCSRTGLKHTLTCFESYNLKIGDVEAFVDDAVAYFNGDLSVDYKVVKRTPLAPEDAPPPEFLDDHQYCKVLYDMCDRCAREGWPIRNETGLPVHRHHSRLGLGHENHCDAAAFHNKDSRFIHRVLVQGDLKKPSIKRPR